MVEESWSPGMTLVAGNIEIIKSLSGPGEEWERCIILDTDLVGFIKDQIYDGRQSEYLEKPSTIRKLAKSMGWFIHEDKTTLRDGTGGRLVCTDADDAGRPPHELFKEIKPTRIRSLAKRKLIVEANGVSNVRREDLEDMKEALVTKIKAA